MLQRPISLYKTLDWATIILYFIMVTVGWMTICGASYDFDSVGFADISGRPGSQLMWIVLSVIISFVVLLIDDNSFELFAYPLYLIMIIVLILTIFIAPDIKGSRSWLAFGSFRIQPAEFSKFITALALAKYVNRYGFDISRKKDFLFSLGIIFLPAVLIIFQKETGSALVYATFLLVLYREGMRGSILLTLFSLVLYFVLAMKFSGVLLNGIPVDLLIIGSLILIFTTCILKYYKPKYHSLWILLGIELLIGLVSYIVYSYIIEFNLTYVILGSLIVLAFYLLYLSVRYYDWHYIVILVFLLGSLGFFYSVDYVFKDILEPHQQNRILVSLGLKDDPRGAGYNVNQSKIAIGSGGFSGKGFLNGTQTKLKYVPEQDTDFIFCTVGEEQGFLGAVFVLCLFLLLISRLIIIAERQITAFSRVYIYSVAAIFLFHFIINIGMVLGITPVIGIPLPFFSYGGSSLLAFSLLLFIALRLDASRIRR